MLNITIDAFPGWEGSISPYRLKVGDVTYSPMTIKELKSNLDAVIDNAVNWNDL